MNQLVRLFRRRSRPLAPADIPAEFSLVDSSDEAFVDGCYRFFLHRTPDPAGRAGYVKALSDGTSRLEIVNGFINSTEFRQRAARREYVPPGHFYSPMPAQEDIKNHRDFDWNRPALPEIDLHVDEQQQLLRQFREIYPSIPFQETTPPGFRYQYVNPTYSFGDGILTHCMIRTFRPRRILEVGSGNSSCLILDTNEQFFEGRIQCAFMDPYPQYLKSLLGPREASRTTIIESRLQDVELSHFDQLEANDILFIDSTHVSKLNSDVNRYFFEIFPRLQPGVLIHIHDVAWPFEYCLQWLEEGRAWNEQYLLRAFLMYNQHFRIRLFTTHLFRFYRDWFLQHMPLCLKNTGGSIWIQKVN